MNLAKLRAAGNSRPLGIDQAARPQTGAADVRRLVLQHRHRQVADLGVADRIDVGPGLCTAINARTAVRLMLQRKIARRQWVQFERSWSGGA